MLNIGEIGDNNSEVLEEKNFRFKYNYKMSK